MLQYSVGTRQQLSPQLFEQIGHYRRKVFINRLGWKLHAVNGMELDEFDGPDAVYVCSHDEEDNVNGVARLLPTTGPYLLEKVFPQLWAGHTLPHDPHIWELSRFAMVESLKTSNALLHQASARTASDLLRQVILTSRAKNARALITVSPVGMERLLRQNNFRAMRAGKPIQYEGAPVVALQIDCRE